MDNQEAIQALGLAENFSQFELLKSYKNKVEDLCQSLEIATLEDAITLLANDIYDKSTAYLALRELYMPSERILQQPIIPTR